VALVTLLVTELGGTTTEQEFNSAIDAVNTAVDLQRAGLRRAGLHVGEDPEELTAVAGALCRRASVGQVLASPLVRDLVATRRGFSFAALDTQAVELRWSREDEIGVAMPVALAKVAEAPFVGRATELARVLQSRKEAAAGERRCVLIGGAAGIGKTRLAAEVAAIANRGADDERAVVLYGRCEEDLGLPYQPFVEALNAYVRVCPADVLDDFAGHRGADLARIVTALKTRVPDLPEVERTDADGQRFLMFEAVVGLLARIADDHPVVLVLDDLHWATKPTVLLLRHILRTDQATRLLVVGTYRDDELDRLSPLTTELAELRRVPGVDRIALRGFDRDGVAEFVAAAAGHELDEGAMVLVEALHAETDGNPFYMDEVLAHLVESGVLYQAGERWTAAPGMRLADVGLPESVRDVVGRRLGRLSPGAVRLLTVAAVIGPTFDADILEKVNDTLDQDVDFVDALDEIEAAGIVDSGDLGRYSFDHALIRETLLASLSSARRARLHRRIGEALEARPDAASHVDALAFHFGEAVGGTDIPKAVDYAIRAAQHALDHLAHEEALAHVERGLHALELESAPDLARRATLRVLQAAALQDGPRESPQGVIDALNAAAADTGAVGAVDTLVRAAELMAEETVFGSGSAPAVPLCAEVLEVIGEDRDDLRARVLGSLVYARATMESSTPELAELARHAVQLARENGDAETRSRALVGHGVVLLSGPDIDELRATGEELVAVARERREAWILSWGLRFVGQAALARGDFDAFATAHAELHRLGSERRHTTAAGWSAAWDGKRAMLDGRLDEVEAHTVAIVERGGNHVNYANAFTAQLFYLRRAQGRLDELVPVLVDAVDVNPLIAGFRVALAVTYADMGRLDEARTHFEFLAAEPDFGLVPRDLAWSGALTLLAETCVALGDRDRAAVLRDLLLPYAGQLIVAATGVACPGPADRYLAMLEELLRT
jgi:hypothetical protein